MIIPEKYLWFVCDEYADKDNEPRPTFESTSFVTTGEPLDLNILIKQRWANIASIEDKSLKAQIIKGSFPNIPINTLAKIIKWQPLRFWLQTPEERERIRMVSRSAPNNQKQKIQNEKLSKGCLICGYNKCAAALDFHHIDASTKTNRVSKIYNADQALEEASKCVVLCKICHVELHTGLIQLPK